MIFSELYGVYYNTVAKVLKAAVARPLRKEELRTIIEQNAFGESILNIEPALNGERWQLLRPDGTTPIRHIPTMPLTLLEKRWLRAICMDPRIRLFGDELPDLPGVEPLFRPEDVIVFDRYADGDPYGDERYIRHFRLILDAIRKQYPLKMDVQNRKGSVTYLVMQPDHLEYSEKDDKFRLIGDGSRYGGTVNLGRIVSCKPYPKPFVPDPGKRRQKISRTVTFELSDQRNALERVLLHFAHFEKQAEKLADDRYRVTVTYEKEDETELVIRILSFGPMVRVTAPQHFVNLIKERLIRQKSCGL